MYTGKPLNPNTSAQNLGIFRATFKGMKHSEFLNFLQTRRDQSGPIQNLSREKVYLWLENLLSILFPQFEHKTHRQTPIQTRWIDSERELQHFLQILNHPGEDALRFHDAVPAIYAQLQDDASAMLAGDPAANSLDEVILSYPGFLAIAVHRIAHTLYQYHVPLLPRLLSEHAHHLTSIDIHPGARIGERFCIDHGTGVVIGETAIIGHDVKLYQGVTLGALSVKKRLAKTQRHPKIEDRVVIYANATILGGDTCVGHDSIIGGNVWLTESVCPYAVVYHRPDIQVRSQNGKYPDWCKGANAPTSPPAVTNP